MRNKMLAVASVVLLTTAITLAAGNSNTDRTTPSKQHLLLVVTKDVQGFRVVSTTVVNSALPKNRSGRPSPWRFEAVGADDQMLYQGGLDDPSVLRGEFRNQQDPGRIDAYFFKKESTAFAIRIPLLQPNRIDFYEVKAEFAGADNVPRSGLVKLGSAAFPVAE